MFSAGQKMVQCRICKGDHWTTKCPYKDTLGTLQESLNQGGEATPPNEAAPDGGAPKTGGRYVPPSMRGGAAKKEGESMQMRSRGMCYLTVFVAIFVDSIQNSAL